LATSTLRIAPTHRGSVLPSPPFKPSFFPILRPASPPWTTPFVGSKSPPPLLRQTSFLISFVESIFSCPPLCGAVQNSPSGRGASAHPFYLLFLFVVLKACPARLPAAPEVSLTNSNVHSHVPFLQKIFADFSFLFPTTLTLDGCRVASGPSSSFSFLFFC